MTDAVKLAGNAAQAVQGGHDRSRNKSDQGGFEMLFRLGAKGAKPEAQRVGTVGKEPVAGWDLLARLEAAIAVRDGALRVGDADAPAIDPAESDKDERDSEDGTDAMLAAAAAGEPKPARKVEKPAAEASAGAEPDDGGDAAGIAAARQARVPDGETKAGKGNVGAAHAGTETKPAASETGSAAASAAVQAGTVKPEGKAGFVAFVPSERTPAASGATGPESQGAGLRDRRSNGGGGAPKVTVVEQQNIVAPAMTATTTTSALVAGLTGDSGWQNSMRSVAASQHLAAQIGTAPLHTMKLQLHPAELGMVTANLRFAGDQLQVELQVENREAYDRLQGDSEAIVKSLRALGYEIDQVSVQQPQIANNTTGRTETNFGSLGSPARDAQAFGQQGQSGGERLGGQGSGRGERNAGGREGSGAQASQDSAQRGIYI